MAVIVEFVIFKTILGGLMDWGQYDQEGTMRQRFQEIDELIDQTKQYIAHSTWTWAEFQQMYDISWIYHENGLEGIVLSYPEIKSAVDKQIISDISLLPTYHDIKNQKACIDLFRTKATQKRFVLTIAFLHEIHTILTGEAVAEQAAYRKDIPIHRTYFHDIVPPGRIVEELQQVIDYLHSKHDSDQHTIELAANVHHRFMRVFPFTQHSGIIGRLLLNYVLWKGGSFPVIIHASDRQRYYEALRGSEADFRYFIADAIDNSLDNANRFFCGQERQTSKKMGAVY